MPIECRHLALGFRSQRHVQFIQFRMRRNCHEAKRVKHENGKDIWLMGGGDIIASFLDADAIDEFIVSIVPVFIGEGIPLIAPRHRHVPLRLRSAKRFPDGVVQVHYSMRKAA